MMATDQLIQEPTNRIRNFMWDKFNVEDIRQLELRPIDSDSEDEDDLDPTQKRWKTIDELYDIISVVGAGAFGIVIACRDR